MGGLICMLCSRWLALSARNGWQLLDIPSIQMHSKLDIDASVVIDDKIACFPLTKGSELDVEAAREAIRSVLPAGGASADSPVLVYWKDSLTVRAWGTIHYSCLPAMPCHLPVAQQLRPPRFGLPAQVEQQLPLYRLAAV